jgi:mono/diheme cytochrome c family protein
MNLLATLLLILAPALRAAPAPAEPADPVARGEKAFRSLGCAQCHLVGDAGSDWGPNLTLVGFRKTPEWLDVWLKDPYAWNAKSEMPKFNLDDATRADLVAYLSAQKGQAWAAIPWRTPEAAALPSVQRGKLIFDRAGCRGCHGKAGVGGHPNNNVTGGLIPELTNVADGFSKSELHWMIQNGSTPSALDKTRPKPMITMPKWGTQLKPEEIDAVGEYLFSLHAKAAPGAAPAKDDF